MQRIQDSVGDLLVPGHKGAWPEVRTQLNSRLAGWASYDGYGTRVSAYRTVDRYVCDRVRRFLAKRHKEGLRGTRPFSWKEIFGTFGVKLTTRSAAVGRP